MFSEVNLVYQLYSSIETKENCTIDCLMSTEMQHNEKNSGVIRSLHLSFALEPISIG